MNEIEIKKEVYLSSVRILLITYRWIIKQRIII